MSIIDRMPEITRRNFEEMAKIEISFKPKPEIRIEKPTRPDKMITIIDLSGKEYLLNIRQIEHSMYITNGKSSYYFDIPDRIEVDKETFDLVMYLATGEKFYRSKNKVKPKIEEHEKVKIWRVHRMQSIREWLSQFFLGPHNRKGTGGICS